MPKKKEPPVDGLGPADKARLRTAIRQVWTWSHARRLCVKRATNHETGFATCEECFAIVAKVYVDHKNPVGEFDKYFVERMFVPSSELAALCKKCHGKKTYAENKKRKESA